MLSNYCCIFYNEWQKHFALQKWHFTRSEIDEKFEIWAELTGKAILVSSRVKRLIKNRAKINKHKYETGWRAGVTTNIKNEQ